MKQVESGNDAGPSASDISRLPAAYIYCRTWVGFKDTFPFDDFNALPDDEIETVIRAHGRDWLKRNRKHAAKLIAERKQDIDEKLAKRKRMSTHRVRGPVGRSAKAKRKLERADATYKQLTTMPSPDDFATIAGLAGWAQLSEFPGELSPSPRMYIAKVPSLNAEGAVATLNSTEWPGVAADALGHGEFAEGPAMLRPRFGAIAESDLNEPERALANSAIAALAREPSKNDRKELRLRYRIALGAAPILQQFQKVPATLDQVEQTICEVLAEHPPIAERVAKDPSAHFAARWWPRGGGVPVSALSRMIESRLNERDLRSDSFDIETAIQVMLKNGEIERIESGPETAYLDSSGAERRNPVLRIRSARPHKSAPESTAAAEPKQSAQVTIPADRDRHPTKAASGKKRGRRPRLVVDATEQAVKYGKKEIQFRRGKMWTAFSAMVEEAPHRIDFKNAHGWDNAAKIIKLLRTKLKDGGAKRVADAIQTHDGVGYFFDNSVVEISTAS